jgi:hypothetical protein
MGCVCDEGYQGYDCSLRKCPWGLDPTSTVTPTQEEFVLRCQADAGYFSLTVLGTPSFLSLSLSPPPSF